MNLDGSGGVLGSFSWVSRVQRSPSGHTGIFTSENPLVRQPKLHRNAVPDKTKHFFFKQGG